MIDTTYIDHMGSDLSVVNAARVSFGKKHTEFLEGDSNLIRYLAEHKHMSPFGHAFASFHVKAPIFVARQLVKHKFLRWNEISRRYVDEDVDLYYPPNDVWRGRSEDKKQGSYGEVDLKYPAMDGFLLDDLIEENEAQRLLYRNLLKAGVAPEQARMVLPQSTMTEWYWSGSLDAFADMCNLRCKNDTQYETRVVANKISEKLLDLFPVSWEALKENDR